MESKEPKAFISYSWRDTAHQELVRHWADRLLGDGVNVILDAYDLKEGHDKNAFMEKMVTDASVSHVLVFCDKTYMEKADERKAGVGTESQIISQEVYKKVGQSKFIPIVCELDEAETPYLPAFLKSRIWIDFSTSEAVNQNWEQLIRLLYGKPQHVKPKQGKTPPYITNDIPLPASEGLGKFNSLKYAILQGKKGIGTYRRDFIDVCINYADELRVRECPADGSIGEKVLEDTNKLKIVRDHLVDWMLLESEHTPEDEFSEVLIELLEKLAELKSRPPEINSWQDSWFEAHSIFVYEVFLYFVAALLKAQKYKVLHKIYATHYLLPTTESYGEVPFRKFDLFYGYSESLQSVLAPEGRQLLAPAAELLKRHADRVDLPFSEIIQADLLTLLMCFITSETYWYPQMLHYASYGSRHPFFIRAARHRDFAKLAIITGVDDAEMLRSKVSEESKKMQLRNFHPFGQSFWSLMNMDKLDTLK